MKVEILSILRKSIKIEFTLKAGSDYLVEGIIEPKLQDIVNDSSNPFDNIALASLLPPLKVKLSEASDKLSNILNEKLRNLVGQK